MAGVPWVRPGWPSSRLRIWRERCRPQQLTVAEDLEMTGVVASVVEGTPPLPAIAAFVLAGNRFPPLAWSTR